MVRTWKPSSFSQEYLHLAWPLDTMLAEDGAVAGFAMERLDSRIYFPIGTLFDPAERRTAFPAFTWQSQLRVAHDLARAVARLHSRGIVVGDLSGRNLWVSGEAQVAFIDCDSMQFQDAETGKVFPCQHMTEDVAPPELLEDGEPAAMRSRQSDNFTLAIIVCQLMMEGAHPYRGTSRLQSSSTRVDNILSGESWLLTPETMVVPRQWPEHPDELSLPPRVLQLAGRCFGEGHRAAWRRPTAAQWAEALEMAAEEVRACTADSTHVFHRGAPECPWCRRDRRTIGVPARPPVVAPPPATTPRGPQPSPKRVPTPAPRPQPPARFLPVGVVIAVVLLLLLLMMLLGAL